MHTHADCAQNGDVETAPLLLRAVARGRPAWEQMSRVRPLVTTKNASGETPLHYAAEALSLEFVLLLLNAGADPKAGDINGQTPVHLASLDGYTVTVIQLLDHGGDIEARTSWGATPLSAAAARGRTSTVAALLLRKAEVDPKTDTGWTPLFAALVGKYKASAQFLRNNGADLHIITGTGNTLLHAVASSGMDEWIVELLEAGLDINALDDGGRTPLDHARENLWSESADLLLTKGAEPGPKPTLHHAAISSDLARVQQFIAADADLAKRDDWHLPPRNWTPLHYAAAGGDLDVVDTLIRAGADPRSTDYSGWTPLVAALAKRHDCTLPSFGLHPWFVHERAAEWLAQLEQQLDAWPSAVGEIGLDRWKPGLDYEGQEEVFTAQLRLAAERDLPASIHCLKSWGRLLELLGAGPLRKRGFLLHSYGGPADMVEPLARLGAYFSFPGAFGHERKTRQRDAFRRMPPNRWLIETDAPDQALPEDRVTHPLGQRLTALMISKGVADSAVPMSLLADHPNVQFNYYRGGLGTCAVEMH